MKKIFKLFTNLLSVLMLLACCFSMAGCEQIKTLEITIQVYNYDQAKMYEEDEVKITVDLYRHLAPKTVDTIIEYVNEGYYDGTVFYILDGYTSQLMVGDLKYDGTTLTPNTVKPQLTGEFEHGSTQGSNLINDEGYIGLWRSWCAQDNAINNFQASNGMDSGRSTLYIPLNTLPEYDGYFCVLGKIDYTKTENDTGINAIGRALSGTNFETYYVYYTGEYDVTKADENYGLTFNYVDEETYVNFSESEKADIFTAEGDQLVQYNPTKIRLPKNTSDGQVTAMIKSVKMA